MGGINISYKLKIENRRINPVLGNDQLIFSTYIPNYALANS
jgi:hypothetical protein